MTPISTKDAANDVDARPGTPDRDFDDRDEDAMDVLRNDANGLSDGSTRRRPIRGGAR